jgi:hypothetical protein
MTSGAIGKGQAMKNLVWFLAWFEEEAKEQLKDDIAELQRMLSPEELKLWNRLSKIANVLHKRGYFLAAKGYFGIDLNKEAEKL